MEHPERAEEALTDALELGRRTGSALLMAWVLTMFAQLKLKRRDITGTASLTSEAIKLAMVSRRDVPSVVMVAALRM